MPVIQTLYRSVLWRGLYYLSAFVVNVLIARHFLSATSGNIYYISSIYSLVLIFISFSIESGIVYFSAKNKLAMGKLLNFALLWSLVTGLLLYGIFFFFNGDLPAAINKPLLLTSSITFICGNLLTTYCTGLFYAKHDFLTPNLLSLIINLALIMVFPFTGHSLIAGITDDNFFYVYFISFLIQGIVLVIAIQAKYIHFKFEGFLTIAEFRLLFRYCATAYIANIIFFLLYRVDYWFVERYCTPGDLGNYIQVSKLAQLFFILPTILASAVFPLTAAGQRDAVNRTLALISRIILLAYSIACFILILTGRWLFPFIFGNSFSGMYQPFLLLVPGILSLSCLYAITAYYAGKNRMMVNIKGSVLALIVIVAANRIFTPVYGINAAALISSIGYIIYQVYVLSVFKKEYLSDISDFFIFRKTDLAELRNKLWLSNQTKNDQ